MIEERCIHLLIINCQIHFVSHRAKIQTISRTQGFFLSFLRFFLCRKSIFFDNRVTIIDLSVTFVPEISLNLHILYNVTMKKAIVKLVGIGCAWMSPLWAMAQTDSLRVDKQYEVQEVVVTGTRNETDIRHLPMTISVVGKRTFEEN